MKIENAYPLVPPAGALMAPPSEGSPDAAAAFSQLLYGAAPVTSLSPHDMLVRQAAIFGVTSGIDLGAKVAGSVAQSINKLVNMA
ncbi:Type III secretion needle MxiH like protein [Sodalis glossinidius str. 'morsitans']|uniref:Type III secretion apparatus n=1 Tax=Sodalis glossinidius (strain morsitans) TaxID=343509 RepID=Q2NTF6_SODGM|nr:type III secretion system inner rod subunit SctI [Sodalis glossinidius]BAE74569.1 putative type III secretion apparatus [Sodalis glossinidius str. 'morsitans']CRL45290.1 Type III secretion needle MxiH like protein [Sodalis glossinidius str. 'morsitans']